MPGTRQHKAGHDGCKAMAFDISRRVRGNAGRERSPQRPYRGAAAMTPSAHRDSFPRDNLPPRAEWPDFLFGLPELAYPDRINCAVELLDRWTARGHGDRPCLVAGAESLTYAELAERVVYWGGGAPGALEALMAAPGYETFAACDTAADDVCLIAFTSGTTGEPKGTMHFHRDLLATCDSYGRHVLRAEAGDRFIGSPPLAFTFGLGGLVLFPLRVGAAAVLIEKAAPDDLLAAVARYRATICFTAPTAYRAMLAKLSGHDVSSLRKCVSAGEALPKATFEAWLAATGIKILDGIGATEMLHIFIGSPEEEIRPGATGKPVPGYEARVVDTSGRELPPNAIGRLAVRGPTGCRYLADERQREYVQGGWNVTGDTYVMDDDGYFWYQARSDDMIVSAGYNIAGPEVEAALLMHPAVAECGVVGAPDEERGQIVKAYVVLRAGASADAASTRLLQEHVKATIAPYKYPRAIEYVAALPRTQTGKLQRFELRRMARAAAPRQLAS